MNTKDKTNIIGDYDGTKNTTFSDNKLLGLLVCVLLLIVSIITICFSDTEQKRIVDNVIMIKVGGNYFQKVCYYNTEYLQRGNVLNVVYENGKIKTCEE